jgi:TolA-binding protein
MNESTIVRLAKSNWHLLLVLAVVIAAIPFVAMRQNVNAPEPIAEFPGADHAMATPAAPQIKPVEQRLSEPEKARATIASHQQRLDADPQGEDAPALLHAMGNLYRQRLGDYEQAASCFERLIDSHPETPNVRDAYLQLVVCYERLGDTENHRRILRRMLNDFPAESEEYQYASQQLGF